MALQMWVFVLNLNFEILMNFVAKMIENVEQF